MSINLGSTAISDVKLGNNQVDKVYLGSELVWGGVAPLTVKALKFTSTGAQTLGINQSTIGTVTPVFEYSTDGQTWSSWDITTTLPFGNGTDLYIRGSNTVLAKSGTNYTNFVFSTTSPVYCYGNIMHLYDYTQDLTTIPSVYDGRGLKYMFQNCTQLVTAPELPAITLEPNGYSYYSMFLGCTSLLEPPSLPATSPFEYAYYRMFSGCTSLNKLPKMNISSYQSTSQICMEMFKDCVSIKMSLTQEGEYINTYDFGATPGGSFYNMFLGTGGTFTIGTPPQVLYTSNETID